MIFYFFFNSLLFKFVKFISNLIFFIYKNIILEMLRKMF